MNTVNEESVLYSVTKGDLEGICVVLLICGPIEWVHKLTLVRLWQTTPVFLRGYFSLICKTTDHFGFNLLIYAYCVLD